MSVLRDEMREAQTIAALESPPPAYEPVPALMQGNLLVCEYMNHRVQCLNHRNEHVYSIGGQRGSAEGQFSYPESILIDDNNRLFVVDSDNHRIQLFELDDTGFFRFSNSFGRHGKGSGEFRHPRDICVDGTGKIMVTDSENHRIAVFSAALEFAANFGSRGTEPGQFYYPHGITVDLRDNIYVADTRNARVSVFTNAMDPILIIDSMGHGVPPFMEPYGLLFDPRTWRLFITDRGRHTLSIVKIDPGPELETNPSFKPLNQVGKKGFRLGEFHYPYGMCLDADGDLFVADGFNHRVSVHNGSDLASLSQVGKRGEDLGKLACPIAVHKCGSGFYGEENHYFEPPSAPQSEYMVHT